MKRLFLFTITTILVSLLWTNAVAQSSTSDSDAVKAVIKNYEDAWNRHDAIALGKLYQKDAAKVNWYGTYYKGRDSIQALYNTIHTSYYKSSHFKTISIEDLTFLKPDIALVHCLDELTGDQRYSGQTFHHRRTILLTKQNGEWKIQAVQNAKLPK